MNKSYIALEPVPGLPPMAHNALLKNFMTLSNVALSSYTVPLAENLGPSYPLTIPFYLPAETIKIFSVRLNFKMMPFRSSATGSASGGAGSVTSGASSAKNTGSNTTGITVGEDFAVTDPGHAHTMAHTHPVDVSAHTHTIVYGVSEGTEPSDITVTIDNIDRTTVLGGPFNEDQADLDLSQFITSTGWHSVELGTGQNGRIVAAVFVEALTRLP